MGHYTIYVIARDREEWERTFVEEVYKRRAYFSGGFSFSEEVVSVVSVNRDADLADYIPGAPAAVVMMLRQKADLEGHIKTLLLTTFQGVPLIPVFEEGEDVGIKFKDQVPNDFKAINGFNWLIRGGAVGLCTIVFDLIGLTERDRKVFISYRRSDGINLADQLFDHLNRMGYIVFKDDYSIKVADSFQARLREKMDEYAFIILIDSPEAEDSFWVNYEIRRALTRKIGVAVLRLPGAGHSKLTKGFSLDMPLFNLTYEKYLEVPSHSKLSKDGKPLGGYVLKPSSLEEVCRFVDRSHTERVFARLQFIFQNVIEKFRFSSSDHTFINERKIFIEKGSGMGGQNLLIEASPRTPAVENLIELAISNSDVQTAVRILIHHSISIHPKTALAMDWVCRMRQFEYDLRWMDLYAFLSKFPNL